MSTAIGMQDHRDLNVHGDYKIPFIVQINGSRSQTGTRVLCRFTSDDDRVAPFTKDSVDNPDWIETVDATKGEFALNLSAVAAELGDEWAGSVAGWGIVASSPTVYHRFGHAHYVWAFGPEGDPSEFLP